MAGPDRGAALGSSELTLLRWLGRGVSLAACWPIFYGLRTARFGLDASVEALLVGVPGLLAGLGLWWWAGYRIRAIEVPTGFVDELGHGLDSVARRVARGAVLVLAALSLALAAGAGALLLDTDAGLPGGLVIVLALVWAALALAWRAVHGPTAAAAVAGLAGAAVLAKPWFAPILSVWEDGIARPFSPTSETHLYFVLPGLALIALAVGLVATRDVRAPAPAAQRPQSPASQAEPVDLPRPEPPSSE